MADLPDNGPASSYSDPIYDRLEPIYEFMRKRVGMFLLAIGFVVVLAVIVHLWVSNRPDAASAAAFAAADRERDKDQRTNAFKALAADGTATDYYRARADIELAQIAIEANDPATALADAKDALAHAGQVTDPDLLSCARMSVAASEDAAGDEEGALKDYTAAAVTAGAKLRANHLQAVVGAANALVALKRPDEAIAQLEPLLSNTDRGAEPLMDAVKTLYWTLKRNQAGGMGGTATGAATATGAETASGAVPADGMTAAANATAAAPVVLPTAPVAATAPAPAPAPMAVPASATPAGH